MNTRFAAPGLSARRARLRLPHALAVAAALLCASADMMAVQAQNAPLAPAGAPQAPAAAPAMTVPTAPAASPLPADAYTYSLPLSMLDASDGLMLRGTGNINGVSFGLRQDERVVRAQFDLDYSYSPALLPAISHIKVLLNSEVVGAIGLPQPAPDVTQPRMVDLPVGALSEYNRLNLELVGHTSLREDDAMSPNLWAQIGPRGAVLLTVVPVDLPNDLALLPVPFFDAHDVRAQDLPVVLPQAPDASRLESAGIVSSWFGSLAGFRGAHFTASLGAIPAHGHAVVLAQPGEIPGLTMPEVDGPTLAIVPNPNDPHGKLLLVTGHNEAEIRQAASALTLGTQTLAGSVARIGGLVPIQPRKPFDAPNWLRHDRPVEFGELMPANNFTVEGLRPGPITLNLRLPPGLFNWHGDGIQVDLHYRYTPRPGSSGSMLAVLAGSQPLQSQPLQSFPIPPSDSPAYRRALGLTPTGHVQLRVPTYLLPPLATLQFRYVYEYLKRFDGTDNVSSPVMSAIDPTSTIDISQLPRYAAMPDLEAFGDAGFPFTRMADLSETAVILPDQPEAGDYSAYLTMMGGMGESTGYPTLGVTVAGAAQAESLRDKDLLVLASGDNQPLINAWRSDMPRGFFGEGVRHTGLWGWLWDRWDSVSEPSDRRPVAAAAKAGSYRSDAEGGMVAGLESPLASGRSVVVVSGNSSTGLDAMVRTLQANRYLLSTKPESKVRGSLAVVQGGAVTSLLDEQRYYIGRLPPWLAVEWFFANHMLLLLCAMLASALLIGLLGSLALRMRAQRRLGNA
ncbi:MAG TPA: cellulose biosynthesis cyclic di-GMP-binding regulatory protein BcsB [Bordetella sp.]